MATVDALTCQVVVTENCYVTLYQETINAAGLQQMKSMIRSGHREVQRTPDGKAIRVWVGDKFWATPAQVRGWTMTREGTPIDRPLVSVIGNRTIEEAQATNAPVPVEVPTTTPAAPRRKPAEVPVA